MAAAAALAGSLVMSSAVAAPALYFGEDPGAGSAAAMPNSRLAQSQFLAQLPAYGVDSLESVATASGFGSTRSLVFGDTGVTASLSFETTVRSVPFNARFATEGANYLDSSFNRRLNFSAPVSAFGLFVIDANERDNDPSQVTLSGQPLTPEQIAARPFDSVDGIFRIVTERAGGVLEVLFDGGTFPATDSSAMFVGLVDSDTPFTNIILVNGTSGLDLDWQDGFGYDELTVAVPIPEPGRWALMAAGLAMVGGVSGWRRRRLGD